MNAPSLESLSWLLYTWEGSSGESTSAETWTKKNETTYEGKTNYIKNGKVVFSERLNIQQIDEHIFYIAIPQGHKPTLFNLVNTDIDKKISFENMEHDFPRRITYTNEGDTVRITLEGKMDGKDVTEEYSLRKK